MQGGVAALGFCYDYNAQLLTKNPQISPSNHLMKSLHDNLKFTHYSLLNKFEYLLFKRLFWYWYSMLV